MRNESGDSAGNGRGALRVEVVHGIDALPEGLWRRLAPRDDPMWTRALFAAMEKGHIGPESYAYLVLRRDERAVAVLPLSLFRQLRLDDVVGPRERRLLTPLRRWAPRLLRVPMLFCGNLLGQGHVLAEGPLTGEEARELVCAVRDFARQEHLGTVVFKDFAPEASPPLREALQDSGFFTVPSMPDTELALGYESFDAYVAALPAKPRRNARSNLRKFAAAQGLRIEVITDYAPLLPAMLDLYGQVMARAGQTLDVLDADFLSALADRSEPVQDSRLIVCFDGDRPVAFLLCLFAGRGATGARIGLDYGVAQGARVYHAVHYAAIRLALARGCRHIRFAQTAYVPKLELGCALVEQTYAFTHLRPLRRALLRRLLPPALAGALADALHGAHEAPPAAPSPGPAATPVKKRTSRTSPALRSAQEGRYSACPE